MKHALIVAGAAILALGAVPAQAQGPAAPEETVTQVFGSGLPNVPGKALVVLDVLYPPGGASPAHTHPKSAFIYAHVLEGEIESAVDDAPPRVYRAGEGWHETPGATHRISRNASATRPARLLAVFILDPGETRLVVPVRK